MKPVIFLKAHISGHFRGGSYVKPYETKAPAAAPKPKPQGWHPHLNDDGDDVPIYKLSSPTSLDTFGDAKAIATVLPGGEVPETLNGVAFQPWDDAPSDIDDWEHVEGQADIDEPPLPRSFGMKLGAGVIVQEPDGRIWVVHPTNEFGGYKGTFPKGTVEEGLSLQASAIKEAYEESGLKVEITGHLMDVRRTTSVARYYLARRIGGTPSDAGWESQSVSLVPVDKLYDVLNRSTDHGLAQKLGAGKPPFAPSLYSAKPAPPNYGHDGKQGSLF